ncbi:hypothetical protein CDL15_Pgr010122 [Punica granatum]|uniref:Uncharacterized protein n=1 Tax=Punica granatum TaxID=22663 RepID=A0A218WL11_PUNGR|nr:hypothetical protein CDL15_Pgr010122 [Punica granatum]
MILDQPSNAAQPSSADSSSSTVGKPSMPSKQFGIAYTTEELRKRDTSRCRRELVNAMIKSITSIARTTADSDSRPHGIRRRSFLRARVSQDQMLNPGELPAGQSTIAQASKTGLSQSVTIPVIRAFDGSALSGQHPSHTATPPLFYNFRCRILANFQQVKVRLPKPVKLVFSKA